MCNINIARVQMTDPSTVCFYNPAVLGSENVTGIGEVYEEDHTFMLRLCDDKI